LLAHPGCYLRLRQENSVSCQPVGVTIVIVIKT
jgi:hypothetical protein